MADFDTRSMWSYLLVIIGIRSIFIFLGMGANPFLVAVGLLYFVSIWSLRTNGSRFKLIFLIIPFDAVMIAITPGDITDGALIFLAAPLVPLAIISYIIYKQASKEVGLFDRTLLSFNHDDLRIARKAMKTLDPIDISEVAEYRDWDTIS